MKRDSLPTPPSPVLPEQPISRDVLAEKYFKTGETTPEQLYARVARALASVEKPELRAEWEQKFLANLRVGAIGAGRIMSAAGTDIQATLINCFVQPVGDAIQGYDADGYPGIYEALREAAETMRRGGGVGYDFSRIRPRGADVKGTRSIASGPCSYINVFDQSCATVESAGSRRGAQMGVLRIDHPDVLDFITAKRTPGRWNNFNVSVGVSDAFMQAVAAGADWELVHKALPGAKVMEQGAYQRADGLWVYRKLPARELWDTIMKSTYDFAEPGVLFLDQIERDNNLSYCERIEATNPCVTADTWIMTASGPAQVQELIGRPFTAIVNGAAYPVQSQGFFFTGHRPVMRLVTCEGPMLRLTSDHRVRRVTRKTRSAIETGWTPAGELQPGDEIMLHQHRPLHGWEGEGTEEQGYLLGLLIGNGVLKARQDFALVRAPEPHQVAGSAPVDAFSGEAGVSAAVEAAARALDNQADKRKLQRPAPTFDKRRLSSAAVQKLALRYGLMPTLTPSMEKTSSAFHVGALRALFDVNGVVRYKFGDGISVRLKQKKELAVLQTAQRMLLRLGIVAKIRIDEKRKYRRVAARRARLGSDVSDGLADNPMEMPCELIIRGDNLTLFAERIGFSEQKKGAFLAQKLAGYPRRLNQEYFTVTVQSVTPEGNADVYDVTVADVHAFDANGLMVHNCGEQPLPPYGCCDLGPIILTRFVRHPFGTGGEAAFDFEAFEQVVATQVRALDNVLDVTFWPLPQQREEAAAKRRIGVGFTGLGNTLTLLKLRYDRADGRAMAAEIARRMRDAAYRASVKLAKEKGAFPKFDAAGYLAEGTFASRLPDELKAAIKQHGIRNSHLLSIAPTGTVSLAFADNASNGIEPAFSWSYIRNKREADGSKSSYTVEDHALRLYRALVDPGASADNTGALPEYFVNALQMSAQDHIAMMQAVQPYVDTSISKTVNVPEDYPYDDFKNLYARAWQAGLKGLATYRPNPILGAVLEVAPAAKPTEPPLGRSQGGTAPSGGSVPCEAGERGGIIEPVPGRSQGGTASSGGSVPCEAGERGGIIEPSPGRSQDGTAPAGGSVPCDAGERGGIIAPVPGLDPMRTVIEKRPPGGLPAVAEKIEYWTSEGQQRLYLIVTFLPLETADGKGRVERAIEFFMPVGQSGESQQWITATMRMLSLAARGGFLDRALSDMRKVTWDRGPVRLGTYERADGAHVPRWHDSEVAAVAYAVQNLIARRQQASLFDDDELPIAEPVLAAAALVPTQVMAGKKCPECGAHAMIRKDGCDYCTQCGFVGSCG
ncbi:MAG: ribonucleoside reductase [Burkholderiaceae bacterium]|nr:ribonucleoside reductase [Burkholderiaceae bacterium]